MPTRVFDVRAALTAAITTPLRPIEVINGPRSRSTAPKQFVLVGSDGGDTGLGDGSEDGMVVDQTRSKVGNNWRDELGLIICSAWAWSGGTDFAPLREQASEMLTIVESALLADRSLGGVLPSTGLAEFGGVRLRERQESDGAVVRAVFTVSYRALLTT